MTVNTIVVSGVLGSGKTTTINKLLPGLGTQTQALVNDIGQLNLDSARIQLPDGQTIGYSSGCVCCERREDLEALLTAVDPAKCETLIVEPSGAANPLDIIDTILGYDQFQLQHVVSVVPVTRWDALKTKNSFLAGLDIANVIGFSWPDASKESELESFLDTRSATANRFVIDDSFSAKTLAGVTRWTPRVLESDLHGHEHYHTTVRPLRPGTSESELREALEQIARKGIPRAKGVAKSAGVQFDIVDNDLRVSSDATSGSSLSYIVLIGEERLTPYVELLGDLVKPGEFAFAQESALKGDYERVFTYYFNRIPGTSPVANGIVQTNFEAIDEAYTAAKELGLRYNDFSALRLVLKDYIDIRLRALTALAKSEQDNKGYTGAMLGAFLIQMLGEHDTVPFDKLTDRKQLETIKDRVVPEYFGYLQRFSSRNLEPIKTADEYSEFFVAMAKQGAPYTNANQVAVAARNMDQVYTQNNKEDIAVKWRDLYA